MCEQQQFNTLSLFCASEVSSGTTESILVWNSFHIQTLSVRTQDKMFFPKINVVKCGRAFDFDWWVSAFIIIPIRQPDFRCVHVNRIIRDIVVLAKHLNILNKWLNFFKNQTIHNKSHYCVQCNRAHYRLILFSLLRSGYQPQLLIIAKIHTYQPGLRTFRIILYVNPRHSI